MRPMICAALCIANVALLFSIGVGESAFLALAIVPGVAAGVLSRRQSWFASYTNNVYAGVVASAAGAVLVSFSDPGDDATTWSLLLGFILLAAIGIGGATVLGPLVWLVWGRTGSSEERR